MIFNEMTAVTSELLISIHQHPFNTQLGKGTLAKEQFVFYLLQDALYLADFSRALSIIAARLSDNSHMQQYVAFSLDAIKSERELHFNYLNQYKTQGYITYGRDDQSPSCFMYTNYLLRMASLVPIEEAIACSLPCFYIYHEVGKKMSTYLRTDHPYYDWINLYSGEGFKASVQAAINIVNELGSHASEKTRSKMVQAFFKATQLEWLFWEGAYNREEWVVL